MGDEQRFAGSAGRTGSVSAGEWVCGNAFTIADCAAAPALFYAAIVQPFPSKLVHLQAYFERLMRRPAVARTLAGAKPYFESFPFRDAIPARFL